MSDGRSDDSDKRGGPRRPLALHVQYNNANEYLSGWTENVSDGGLFIRSDGAFYSGQQIELTFSFPGLLQSVRTRGEVAWVRHRSDALPGGIGVRIDSQRVRRKLASLAAAAGTRTTIHTGSPYDILLVDSNVYRADSCRRVVQHLQRDVGDGLRLHVSDNGHLGFEAVEQHAPDLVITGVEMPVMNGTDLIRKLRQTPFTAHLPIIAMVNDAEERQRAPRQSSAIWSEKRI